MMHALSSTSLRKNGRTFLAILIGLALVTTSLLSGSSPVAQTVGPAPLLAPPEPGSPSLPGPSTPMSPGGSGAGFANASPASCTPRIPGIDDPSRLASVGVIRIAAVFVDYPNAASSESTQATLDRNWPQAEEFLESQSRGRLDVQLQADDTWHRMSKPSTAYGFNDGVTYQEHVDYINEAVALADPTFDFTGTDAIWVIGEHTSIGIDTSPALVVFDPIFGVVAEGGDHVFLNGMTRGNDWFDVATPGLDRGEIVAAHETLHNMGLLDLYTYDDLHPDLHRLVGNFDPMGSLVGFDYSSTLGSYSSSRANELFAWHSWQLGWLDDNQMRCVDPDGAVIAETLVPAATGDGMRAIVAPLSPTRILVVEARARVRWDSDMGRDGILVYTVDSSIAGGQGPVEVLGAYPGLWPDASVLLQPGESLSFEGYRVQAVAAAVGAFDVQVTTTECGGEPITIDMTLAGVSGQGTPGDDVILGTSGNDVIEGLGGNDTICGGDGDDVVLGGDGDDMVFAGDGRDTVRGGPGNDSIRGGSGNDRILGGTGSDSLDGDDGNDFIGGFGGNDVIDGGAGDEVIFGGFGADVIDGGPGDDEVHGLVGNDVIDGGTGDDVLDGERGNDDINGGDGNDLIRGGNASDVLFGGAGDDDLKGGKADDQLFGGPGTDICVGNTQFTADTAGSDCESRLGIP